MTTKTCFKCLCEKPLGAFYRHAQMADGHLNKCKECTKSDATKHRWDNIDAVRAYDNNRAMLDHRVAARKAYARQPDTIEKRKQWMQQYQPTQESKKKHALSVLRWKENFPERRAANTKVGNALRDGVLNKLPCLCCGEVKVHGHHPDYSRPLDVVWLCAKHHREVHAMAF